MSIILNISYSHPTDVLGTDESIHYSEVVTLGFGLVSEMIQAPTEVKAEKKTEDVLEKAIQSVTLQKVEFSVHATDKQKTVVENLIHHETVSFEFEGETYTAKIPVEVSSEKVAGVELYLCKIVVTYAYTVSRDSVNQVTINTL